MFFKGLDDLDVVGLCIVLEVFYLPGGVLSSFKGARTAAPGKDDCCGCHWVCYFKRCAKQMMSGLITGGCRWGVGVFLFSLIMIITSSHPGCCPGCLLLLPWPL